MQAEPDGNLPPGYQEKLFVGKLPSIVGSCAHRSQASEKLQEPDTGETMGVAPRNLLSERNTWPEPGTEAPPTKSLQCPLLTA